MDNMIEMYEWLTAWERYNATGDKKRSPGESDETRRRVRVRKNREIVYKEDSCNANGSSEAGQCGDNYDT